MKTVLLGWELGANLGHAKPLAAIAKRLGGNACRVVVAARDLRYAGIAFKGMAVTLLQAPIWPAHRHFGSETGQANYLDIVVQIGFCEADNLSSVVRGWLALMDLVQPDLVVADHSPALQLAAAIRNVDLIQVGSGFTMPPLDYDRFPPLRADRAPIISEARVLATVATVFAEQAAPEPRALIDTFRARKRFVFCCPELDPYAPFRREPLYLPPEPLPEFIEPPVVPKLFAYLGPEIPKLDNLVQVLAELGVQLEVFLRGEAGPLARFLRLSGHIVHDDPPDLADVLLNASHVISASGAFTCHAALFAGRPMLGIALHGEAQSNITAMTALGSGRRLTAWDNAAELHAALLSFLRDHTLLQRARHWANVTASRRQPSGLDAASAAITELLAAGATPV